MLVPTFHYVISLYYSTTYQTLSLWSTDSLLCLTNASLKYRSICLCCSISLYSFVVFQVESVRCLLYTMYTVKPRKPLISLLFHCQLNHHDCRVSIPTHCQFKQSKFDIHYNLCLHQLTALVALITNVVQIP